MINNVTLVGRAGGDPEIKYFDTGTILTTINIALSRATKDKSKPEVDWVTVKFFGKQAEIAAEYVKKGHLFGVESGELKEEKWEKDGKKYSKIVVVGRQLKLMPNKDKSQDSTESTIEEMAQDLFAGVKI